MPSKKRKIQYLLDDNYYLKFKEIMTKEKRKSESQMSQYIVEKYIDEYEKRNGNIKIEIGRDNNGNIDIN